jgi:hypothetical protein
VRARFIAFDGLSFFIAPLDANERVAPRRFQMLAIAERCKFIGVAAFDRKGLLEMSIQPGTIIRSDGEASVLFAKGGTDLVARGELLPITCLYIENPKRQEEQELFHHGEV